MRREAQPDPIREAFVRVQSMVTDRGVPMEKVQAAIEEFRELDAPKGVLDDYLTSLDLAFEQRSPGHNPG